MEKIKRPPNGGLLFWQSVSCNSRTNEIKDLLQFGKELKEFVQIL